MKTLTRRAIFAATALLALAATTVTAIAENAKVRLAYLLTDSMLPMFYADEKGYFKDAGIDLEKVSVQGGPAVVAALAAGEADLGYSAFIPPINARLNGVPLKLFLVLSHEAEPDNKLIFLSASGASGIKSLADVKGKKISFNANGGLCELTWRDHLMKAGMKLEDAQVVVLPFPEQEAALEQGNIDAVCTINPFYSSMQTNKNLGLVDIAKGMLADLSSPVISDGVYASEEWLAKNSETASKFAQVMHKARKELLADRAALEATTVKYMELTPEAAKLMVLPIVREEMSITAADVQRVLDAMIKTGMQSGSLNGADFVAEVKY